ncbi:MAG: hypothetical protein ACP5E3_13400, partial [Bacteroidales bacterium]
MKLYNILLLLVFLVFACTMKPDSPSISIPEKGPIQLHPENPHYFLYKGDALALITSAEHYGALINLDFNYQQYLETLAAEGMNYTRIFTGTYFEIPGESFGIQKNTLAPQPGRVIAPWKEVEKGEDGRWNYDLSQWNPAYFERLKDLMSLASEKDIIVEVTLFSSIYRQEHWDISPQNPVNNVNIDHEVSLKQAHTPNNGELLAFQELFVRKMVQELNEFDNFFFEIQNEPWSDHAIPVYNINNKEELRANDWTFKADFADEKSMTWQTMIAGFIVDEESQLPKKHLIAQNYTNFKAPIPKVGDNISIINFHYAWPEAAEWNYHYNRVLGFDESGFAGSGDKVYRRQAWRFMLSGGGLFNNLDYSFYAGEEDGDGKNNAPGGGSKELRKQLKILSDFLHDFELEGMNPDKTVAGSSPGLIPYILSDGGDNYAIFLRAVGTTKTHLEMKTGPGEY